MQHASPFCSAPVVVRSVVVDKRTGLPKLRLFLQHFLQHSPRHTQLSVGGTHTTLFVNNGVTAEEVIQLFQTLRPNT